MRTVEIKKLTLEGFSKYGSFANMINPDTPKLGAEPIEFYRDMVGLDFCDTTKCMFSVCRVCKRPAVINVTEFHNNCCEGILPLDADVVMHVGIATADNQPALDEIEVFNIPKGTFIAIRPGVWHHAVFVVGADVANVLIVLPERTYAVDCIVVDIPESQQLQIKSI